MKPTLLVLAAGMGSRYGGLKQLDPVGPSGETLLDYSVYDAIQEGFGTIVFVIRRDIESSFREIVGQRYAGKIQIEYVFQELDALPEGHSLAEGRSKPWGTGHAILCAKDTIKGPFGVINADDFYGRDAFAKLANFLTHRSSGNGKVEHAIIAYRLGNTLSEHGSVSRGICEEQPAGFLATVAEAEGIEPTATGARCPLDNGEFREFSGEEAVSMNLWGFGSEIFTTLNAQFSAFLDARGTEEKSEFYIPTAVDTLIQSGEAQVRLIRTSSQWFGVTYRDDKPRVATKITELVRQGIYPGAL